MGLFGVPFLKNQQMKLFEVTTTCLESQSHETLIFVSTNSKVDNLHN